VVKTRVLIADDHAILRSGLRLLINAQPDLEVVGEAGDALTTVEQARLLAPDVVTVDLGMPGADGVGLVERLRRECPAVRVLVLTMHSDLAYLRAALAAGAAGYIVKTAADTELVSAIHAVRQGRIFVDLTLSEGLAQVSPGSAAGPSVPADRLSRREREVLRFVAEGHTNQQIADRLHLSVKTIETYRARVGEKLGLRSRADIVRYALDTGLISPGPTPPDVEPFT
jgi:DNA-binding NarL/FixJ family response regulator